MKIVRLIQVIFYNARWVIYTIQEFTLEYFINDKIAISIFLKKYNRPITIIIKVYYMIFGSVFFYNF